MNDYSDRLKARLETIKKYHPKIIDLSLRRILRLLNDLGSPHMRLPPVVHVAGTNGKGSVIATMRSILESAGYSVHVYTSPHLVSFNERIRVKGDLIETSYLLEMLDYIEKLNKDLPITFFEFITALAYEVFSRDKADILLLETGLGGRLDATNVIKNPLATVLTTIDVDHESYLGKEISKIAFEKASIMKKGSLCVSCSQHSDSIETINLVANNLGVDIYWEGLDWSMNTFSETELNFSDINNSWNIPMPILPGDHQIINLGVALATLSRIPFSFTEHSLLEGILNVEWKGRFQKLKLGPLLKNIPDGWDIWLDGGHNNSAAVAISNWLKKNGKESLIIFGMMRNKDARQFLEILAPHISALATVNIKSQENAFSSKELFLLGKEVGINNLLDLGDINFSINSIMPFMSKKSGCILICGSLYLAGEVLKNHD